MKYNVLSIDWDYFIDATSDERLLLFPDGGTEDVSLSLSNYIWAIRYAESSINKELGVCDKCIEDIGIRENELLYIYRCLSFAKNNALITISDSHADIYDFLIESNPNPCKQFNIYNIDHHSDCYNIGNDVNCGNWVNRLDDKGYINSYTWIKNSDSDNSLVKSTLSCETKEKTILIDTLNDIDWDYIFICRSSVWSPPHLDLDFNEFHDVLYNLCDVEFNHDFFINRYGELKR